MGNTTGAGKSYIGDLIGKHLSWKVYHADEDLTDEMILALEKCRPFTDPMRDRYIETIVDRIRELQAKYEHIVVTQGLYKSRHRSQLQHQIKDIELICVRAPETQLIRRIQKRPYGISLESARALFKDFEYPDSNTKIINNNSSDDELLIEQLNQFYS